MPPVTAEGRTVPRICAMLCELQRKLRRTNRLRGGSKTLPLNPTRCFHTNSAFAQIPTRPASSSTRPSAGEALRAAGAGQAVASAGHRAKKNEREAQCERCRSFLKEAVKGYSGELAGFPLLFRSGPSGNRLHER